VSFGKSLAHGRQVEAQPSAGAAEADAAECAGVEVDPVALDAQLARDGRGVDEPARARGTVLVQQLDHAPGDPLDVVGDQAKALLSSSVSTRAVVGGSWAQVYNYGDA
jgi:hypothetical protein